MVDIEVDPVTDLRDEDTAPHLVPGSQKVDSTFRGQVPGQRRPGHRLGLERGLCLRAWWPSAEPVLPRLLAPDHLCPSDDRHGGPQNQEPRTSLRLARLALGGGRFRRRQRDNADPEEPPFALDLLEQHLEADPDRAGREVALDP